MILNILKKLPDTPGIYLFYSAKKELIYVGKATSLKSRVKSYFRGQRSPRPIEEMIHEVVDIKWEVTDSVLEAVILEAEYIKKFQPTYNVDGKDDKSWNYIVISKDAYPKVETVRQREYQFVSAKQWRYVFGPYPGLNTPVAMKLLRRMFRFSNCVPLLQGCFAIPARAGKAHGPGVGEGGERPDTQRSHPPLPRPSGELIGRPCLYRQMGWCPGVCTGEINPEEYRRQVIRPLVTFLAGRKKQVIKIFESEMKRAGKDERFEDAARLRDQLKSLNRIQDIALLNKSWFVEKEQRIKNKEKAVRIEGYDISNLGASDKVGSMVVFNEEGPVKSEYRKFIIKTVPGQSDIDSLAEVLERRFNHSEWKFPSAILIDGGRLQVAKAVSVLRKRGVKIPIVGIAKGPERKRNDFIIGTDYTDFGEDDTDVKQWREKFIIWVEKHKKLLIQARNEAHRFAITFHRARRGRKLLTK